MNIRKAEMIYPGEMLPRLIGPRHRRSVFPFRRNRALSAHRKLSHRHRSTPAMLFLHYFFHYPFLSSPLFSTLSRPFHRIGPYLLFACRALRVWTGWKALTRLEWQ